VLSGLAEEHTLKALSAGGPVFDDRVAAVESV
jgi:hypothetical protein